MSSLLPLLSTSTSISIVIVIVHCSLSVQQMQRGSKSEPFRHWAHILKDSLLLARTLHFWNFVKINFDLIFRHWAHIFKELEDSLLLARTLHFRNFEKLILLQFFRHWAHILKEVDDSLLLARTLYFPYLRGRWKSKRCTLKIRSMIFSGQLKKNILTVSTFTYQDIPIPVVLSF